MKRRARFRGSMLSLLGVCAVAAACGGNSASRRSGDSGSTAGVSSAGRAAGATGSAGGPAGIGGTSGGSSGSATGGASGAPTSGAPNPTAGSGAIAAGMGGAAGGGGLTAGGRSGAGAGNAGEQSGGADDGGASSCLNLCKEDAPACCTPGLECVTAVPSCRIDILDGQIDLRSEYADIKAKIDALSGEVVLSIPDAGVALAAADPAPSARFEFTLNERATELYAPALATFYTQAFRLSCDGEELFVGLIYNRYGAAALAFPVLHIEHEEGEPVHLLLGASLGEWTGLHGTSTDEAKQRIDRPELRAAFCAKGVLSVLDPQ